MTMKLFVYGTLRDPLVYERVVGKKPSVFSNDFYLSDFSCFYVEGELYPGLAMVSDEVLEGSIFEVSEKEMECLKKYEDPEDYELVQVALQKQLLDGNTCEVVDAFIFVNKPSLILSDKQWSFERFQKSAEKELVLEKIKEWMA